MHTGSDLHIPEAKHTHYDIVVIGSGLGGLLCAVILAKEGKKVLVLEKNKQIGGCLQTFSLHKKVFDSCVHYIGGLAEGETLNRIFSYAGIMDKLVLKAYDANGFDRICFGDELISYPHACGRQNFIDNLAVYFPDEKSNLDQYWNELHRVGDHFPLYRLRLGDASEKQAVTHYELNAAIRQITPNKRLQQVLMGNNLLYAGGDNITPFYLHALVSESYLRSTHKVEVGSSQISKFLWQELQKHGAEVIRNTAVTKIAEEQGIIQYVETEYGERYYGRQFISNLAPAEMLRLLQSTVIKPAFRKRIGGLRQTSASFMLNLVLAPGKVAYRNYNLYWHRTDNALAAIKPASSWPDTYALYWGEDTQHPGYADTLSILTYMDFEEMHNWQGSYNHVGKKADRGQAYLERKTLFAERLLAQVTERYPELQNAIIAQSIATPLTYRDYKANPEGSMYGIQKNVHSSMETTIACRTKIPNLFQTGENVNIHGVLGVSITAIATCAELLGMEYLLDRINK